MPPGRRWEIEQEEEEGKRAGSMGAKGGVWVRLLAITGIALNYANSRMKNETSERMNELKLELLINLWIAYR